MHTLKMLESFVCVSKVDLLFSVPLVYSNEDDS